MGYDIEIIRAFLDNLSQNLTGPHSPSPLGGQVGIYGFAGLGIQAGGGNIISPEGQDL